MTSLLTKNCGGLLDSQLRPLLPSLRATWQEEEFCSSTSGSRGPQYPGFHQPITAACLLPSSPGDEAQGLRSGSEESLTSAEKGGGRCQPPSRSPSPPSPALSPSPGEDPNSLNYSFQVPAKPPTSSQGPSREREAATLCSLSSRPGGGQPRASKQASESLGSHFPNHRSDRSPAAVMKDLGPEWAGRPGRGHHYRMGSSCSSWAPPPASGQGDLQGRADSTIQSNPIPSNPEGGPKQLFQLLRKSRLRIRDPSRRRRRRWWAGTRSPKLPPSKPGLGPGVNPLDSTRLFCPKVHGPPSPARREAHSTPPPTAMGVCRHVLPLPINNSLAVAGCVNPEAKYS